MQELKVGKNNRILIIAPHPDDEVFCCGSVLMNYAGQCDVVLLTYGEKGNPGWSESETAYARREEFRNVMKRLEVHKYIEFKIPDSKIDEEIQRLKKIPFFRYDYIFLPNRYDIHPDHNCIYRFVKQRTDRQKVKPVIFEYEMWGMFRKPSHYIDITGRIDEKKELMRSYKSQEIYINYCDRIVALNYFRAIEISDADYIECFYTPPQQKKSHIRNWADRVAAFCNRGLKKS